MRRRVRENESAAAGEERLDLASRRRVESREHDAARELVRHVGDLHRRDVVRQRREEPPARRLAVGARRRSLGGRERRDLEPGMVDEPLDEALADRSGRAEESDGDFHRVRDVRRGAQRDTAGHMRLLYSLTSPMRPYNRVEPRQISHELRNTRPPSVRRCQRPIAAWRLPHCVYCGETFPADLKDGFETPEAVKWIDRPAIPPGRGAPARALEGSPVGGEEEAPESDSPLRRGTFGRGLRGDIRSALPHPAPPDAVARRPGRRARNRLHRLSRLGLFEGPPPRPVIKQRAPETGARRLRRNRKTLRRPGDPGSAG